MLWVRMNTGKRNPLDAEPVAEGDVAIAMIEAGGGGEPPTTIEFAVKLGGEVLEEARAEGAALRTSHFATCPDAERFRTRRAA